MRPDSGRGRRARWLALGLGAVLAATAAGPTRARLGAPPPGPAAERVVPCPPGGHEVPAGADLQAAVDAAPAGSALCLSPGTYEGPLEVRVPLTLQGPRSAVIRSSGEGTTVRVQAGGVVLDGFTIEGSGRRHDRMDAAVHVRGDGVVVRGLLVRDALFGIVAERSRDVRVAGNEVSGLASLPAGIRGDGIRLWEMRAAVVDANRVSDSRDVLVSYSPGTVLEHNTVLRSRYGTHFMYSDDSVVRGSEYRENVVGVFVMYSRGIAIQDNALTDNLGFDGMGLGAKESGNLVVERNLLARNRACVYLDDSPFREGDSVLVRANLVVGCATGVTFHASETASAFVDNVLQGNGVHVTVEGRGTARGVTWMRNYFDDYRGYDLDGDGLGDVPYEARSFSERLIGARPELAFLRGTIALRSLDVAARALPVLQPETLLVDPKPRMSPSREATCASS